MEENQNTISPCNCSLCMSAGVLGSKVDSNAPRKSFWLGGERVTFVATGEETNGQFSQFDLFFPQQSAAIPHIHQFAEAFYVLDGELSFQLGEKTFTATPGDLVYIPSGQLHGWRNVGTEPARALVTAAPSGAENLFEAVGLPGTSAPPLVNEKLLAATSSPMFGTEAPDSFIFTAAEYSVNEDGSPIVAVTVLRPGSSQGEVGATINLSDGTATNPENYSDAQLQINFADGERIKTVDIPIVDNNLIEANKTINLTLSDPTGGAIIGLLQDTATLTIVDDDARPNGENGVLIVGDDSDNVLEGGEESDNITGGKGNDTLTGSGNQDLFTVRLGDGINIVTDFGGVGTGTSPSADVAAEVDTLRFEGAGLTAKNMLLTQDGSDLLITFEGVDNTGIKLQDFPLENLESLRTTIGASVDIGNVLFDGQKGFQDSFDVFNAKQQSDSVFNPNSITFLNDLDNNIRGFDNSNDVINSQGGNDLLEGLSGDDLLRGGTGDDTLVGGFGLDTLVGGSGGDLFVFAPRDGIDTIADFTKGEDLIGLSDSLSFDDLTIIQGTDNSANDTLINITDSNELLAILSGVQASAIASNDFQIV